MLSIYIYKNKNIEIVKTHIFGHNIEIWQHLECESTKI